MNTPNDVVISAISAAIAAASALIAAWTYRREALNQKISAAKWKKDYFADLLRWSDAAMLLLSEAMHLCELDPRKMGGTRFFDLRHALRVQLSAHIDRGRWFFPNYPVGGVGDDKQEAFRGYRHEVLDGLVAAYGELSALNYIDTINNRIHRSKIEFAKRMFTSEIQRVLDPRSRDAEFRKLVGAVSGA